MRSRIWQQASAEEELVELVPVLVELSLPQDVDGQDQNRQLVVLVVVQLEVLPLQVDLRSRLAEELVLVELVVLLEVVMLQL